MTPIIIDIEASCTGKGSYPIEIGLVLPDGTPHCFLIAPDRTWTAWSKTTEEIHGITRETLLAYGRPVGEVAWRLNELLRSRTAYSDAWSLDVGLMQRLYGAAHERQAFRIAPLNDLLDEQTVIRWEKTKQQVVHELALQRHRASSDARILQQTYRRLYSAVA